MDIPSIIFEDEHLLVLNKPAGMVVHPAYKNLSDTLFNFALDHVSSKSAFRPCLLHRLDKDTSGLVLLAKTPESRRYLVRQFEHRTIQKEYLAIAEGIVEPQSGEIHLPLRRDPEDRRKVIVNAEGQSAHTIYKVLEHNDSKSALQIRLITGRMHQIRAHLAAIGHPIAGDKVYNIEVAESFADRLMLHAHQIVIKSFPEGTLQSFHAPVPNSLVKYWFGKTKDSTLKSFCKCFQHQNM